MIAARVAFGPGGFRQSCDECRATHNETDAERGERIELRRKWGCDGPTAVRGFQMRMSCVSCNPKRARKSCQLCEGNGNFLLRECPWSLVRPVHFRVCQAFSFAEAGILPVVGGWHDQSATFVEALGLVAAEHNHYQEQRLNKGGQN